MSTHSPEPDEDGKVHQAKVVSIVTHHTVVPGHAAGLGAKSKTKPKDKKETKTKEFSHKFEASEDNHLELLRTILVKHGESQYNITAKMVYTIKVQLPGSKKTEALDIDTWSEYKDLAKGIVKDLPVKVTIYVDMEDIQKRWSHDPGLYDSNGLSDQERSYAHFRRILETKYQNDHDAGYTYIDATSGTSYPLTPQMMKEWCRAMVHNQHDGLTDRDTPPATLGFNVANRQPALHPSRIAAGVNQPAISDIGHLATILTTIMNPRTQAATEQPVLPSTPKQNVAKIPADSPVIPTPSKLHRFLKYAAENLGIPSAPSFEFRMDQEGYGPDILHLLEDSALVELGMTKGDVLRIKAGAQAWWKGPNAKRKRSDVEESDAATAGGTIPAPFASSSSSFLDPDLTPPSKKVAFELRFPEGGGQRFWGPRMTPCQFPSQND
ncbi:hypothetical protein B0H11DRAFT_1713897 [Mycena galericulata]|nr:hypothetical protein B0H11DRAFT_1713897 [Mycena galericulata]